jgi:hypothetical protein
MFTVNLVSRNGNDHENEPATVFVRVLMLAWSLISLGLEVFQLSREGVSKYFLDGWNWIDIASIAGVMSSVGLEWMKHNHLERLIAALTVTILGWKVLFHLRGVERTSFLVTMSAQVIIDLWGFGSIFLILWLVLAVIFSVLRAYPNFGWSAEYTCECALSRCECCARSDTVSFV